ncbi:MAG: L,D-transpeptidase [Candidatus Zixiibacteriota bacterium]
MKRALDALGVAKATENRNHYKSTLKQAEQCLLEGEKSLRKQNASWWPFVSYEVADSLFEESIRLSRKVVTMATNHTDARRSALLSNIESLTDSLNYLGEVLSAELGRTDVEALYRKVRLKLDLATKLAETGSYASAQVYTDSVRSSMAVLSGRLLEHQVVLEELLADADRWVIETVKRSSETREPVLIVDKSAHRLYVLRHGAVVDSYSCDLGYNAGYQKKMSGDGATPEGMYRVVEVKKNSKYYRALLLDYPNKYDRRRFQKNLSEGVIPSHARIGGLIEIHGEGGRDEDWTEGCVAVSNDDMNKLMKIASVGTLVTIVRSWDGIQ